MNDEIKEILEALKRKSERYNYCLKNDISFSDENYQAYLLLDYITNLQEENNSLKQMSKDTYDTSQEIMFELQERIDKAIDYITTEQLYTNYQWGKSQYEKILKDLLNILQGVGKDER